MLLILTLSNAKYEASVHPDGLIPLAASPILVVGVESLDSTG